MSPRLGYCIPFHILALTMRRVSKARILHSISYPRANHAARRYILRIYIPHPVKLAPVKYYGGRNYNLPYEIIRFRTTQYQPQYRAPHDHRASARASRPSAHQPTHRGSWMLAADDVTHQPTHRGSWMLAADDSTLKPTHRGSWMLAAENPRSSTTRTPLPRYTCIICGKHHTNPFPSLCVHRLRQAPHEPLSPAHALMVRSLGKCAMPFGDRAGNHHRLMTT